MIRTVLSVIAILVATQASAETKLSFYPNSISKDCFGGRAVSYDECGFQRDVINTALREASSTDKRVLIVFGAEWCVWCHIFKAHIKGDYGVFKYTAAGTQPFTLSETVTPELKQLARDLYEYVAENFVVASIEAQHSFDGYDVLNFTGAAGHIGQTIPYIYAVDKNANFIADMPDARENPALEVRIEGENWYRGYDRVVLLSELKKLGR